MTRKTKNILKSMSLLIRISIPFLILYLGVVLGIAIMREEYNKHKTIETYYFENPTLVREDNTIDAKSDNKLYVTGEIKFGYCYTK